MEMILVSACLAGVRCRYDGQDQVHPEIQELVRQGRAIAVCPEVLGGLSIPRPCCEIQNESGTTKVVDQNGCDRTHASRLGAKKTLAIAKESGCSRAILKSRSPSCGFGRIYDGTFSGTLTDGNGLTADLLARQGIKVTDERHFD